METWTTNDLLTIPKGAIKEGEKYRICYKADTDFGKYKDLMKGEEIISSIADFHIHSCPNENFNFKKAVQITVYHAVRSKSDLQGISVVCIDDQGKQTRVTRCQDLNKAPKLPFFVCHDTYVEIFTTHFSKYVCCRHGSEEPSSSLSAEIYLCANYINQSPGYRVILTLSMAAHCDVDILRSVHEVSYT